MRSVICAMYDAGYPAAVQESTTTSTMYIECPFVSSKIRVSDHSFGKEWYRYNFTPRSNGGVSMKDGRIFYPMNDFGIEAFVSDLMNDCPLERFHKKPKSKKEAPC